MPRFNNLGPWRFRDRLDTIDQINCFPFKMQLFMATTEMMKKKIVYYLFSTL